MSTPPGNTARDQVARLLTLVPMLHAQQGLTTDRAAEVLGCTPAQVIKDLRVLFMCGLPGGYPDDLIDVDMDALSEGGDGVIRVSNADYLARPLRLTPTEASALIVALRTLRSSSHGAARIVIDRTLAKLERAASGSTEVPAHEVGAGPGTHPDSELTQLRLTLESAVAAGHQVELVYWVPSRDETTRRRIDPRALLTHAGVAYLDAWCHTAEAPRLFRLDRIEAVTMTTDPVSGHTEDPIDLSDGFFGDEETMGDLQLVTLDLDADAHWVPEYYPVRAQRPGLHGVLEVDVPVADERWLRRLLLRLAPHARVVAPPEPQQSFIGAARATLKHYE